jgi:hypothetical protein
LPDRSAGRLRWLSQFGLHAGLLLMAAAALAGDAGLGREAEQRAAQARLEALRADIAALAVTDSNIIVGNGSNWVAESGATARSSLGLGTMAVEAAGDYWKRDAAATWTNAHIFDGGSTPSAPATDEFRVGNGIGKFGGVVEAAGINNGAGGVNGFWSSDGSTIYGRVGSFALSSQGTNNLQLQYNGSTKLSLTSGGAEMPTGTTLTADTIAAADGVANDFEDGIITPVLRPGTVVSVNDETKTVYTGADREAFLVTVKRGSNGTDIWLCCHSTIGASTATKIFAGNTSTAVTIAWNGSNLEATISGNDCRVGVLALTAAGTGV